MYTYYSMLYVVCGMWYVVEVHVGLYFMNVLYFFTQCDIFVKKYYFYKVVYHI